MNCYRQMIIVVLLVVAAGAVMMVVRQVRHKAQGSEPLSFTPMLVIEHKSHEPLKKLQKNIQQAIHAIVVDELSHEGVDGAAQRVDDFFLIKPRLWTTILYVGQFSSDAEACLITMFELMQKFHLVEGVISTIRISQRADFFGKMKDELVLLVDHEGQLTELYNRIKRFLIQMNNAYQTVHPHPFFETASWDAFPFIPHVSLGRLRVSEIKAHLAAFGKESAAENLIVRIKDRIARDVFPMMMIDNDRAVLPSSHLELFGKDRTSVLSITL